MRIRIETEKVFTGAKERKILKITARTYGCLPLEYRERIGAIYLSAQVGPRKLCSNHGVELLGEGGIYQEGVFQEILKRIETAGELLAAVNREIKKGWADWNGPETFVI